MMEKMLPILAPVLAHLGETPVDVRFLSRGATCTIWRVRSNARCYALRLVGDGQRVPDGDVDAFLRSSVQRGGGSVAVPILNSEASGHLHDGKRWSLEPLIDGTHPQRGALSRQTCKALGQTLAALHEVPARRFGPVSAISGQVIAGKFADPHSGVAERFENPLPETWADDFTHPALAAMPERKDQIMARLLEVSARVNAGGHVVCHTDLHERQLMCRQDTLVALIDFGGASILDRHWDLGSVRYFHGERNFTDVYDAYRSSSGRHQSCPDMSVSFSVAIGLHHASRSRLPGKSHRFERAIRYIRDAV